MAHFGVLSYKGSGHLNPLIALSKELMARRHRVTFFLPGELEDQIRQQGLGFSPIDISYSSNLTSWRSSPNLGLHEGRIGEMRTKLERIDHEMGAYLREYPRALRAADVDALLMGEITLTGPTVAEMLRLPYFVISTSIPHNFGWGAPESIWPERFRHEQAHDKLLEVSIFHMKGPVRRALDRHRMRLGLRSIREIRATFPELAHMTQWPKCLDLPRPGLPANFYYTGPYADAGSRVAVPFPWEKLDGRPLVYASLGTTKRADVAVLQRVAEACADQTLQLVITLGGRHGPALFDSFPGNALVVPNAPQLELLKRAEVVITHAGPNTVLETLQQGKPMLALPMALDQPAVAAHLARLGAAEVLPPGRRSVGDIRAALLKVRNDSGYRKAAEALQAKLSVLHGAVQAANIIETKLAGVQEFDVVRRSMTVI